MSGHTKQNQFHGQSGRHWTTIPKGGVARVTPAETIGYANCWCQGDICIDGWWPGRDEGKPHPREAVSVTELGDEVPTMTDEHQRIEAKHLKAWHKKTTALIQHIVNDCEVRYRVLDGMTLILYPPDGVSRPFKVSANRSVEVNDQILRVQFIEQFGLPTPEQLKEGRHAEASKAAVVEFSSAPVPTPPKMATPLAEVSDVEPVEEEWQPVVSRDRNTAMTTETNGVMFRCIACREKGETYIRDTQHAMSGHMKVHRAKRAQIEDMSEQVEPPKVVEKRVEMDITDAINLIAKTVGVDVGTDRIAEQEEEIADLNRQVSSLLAQVAELTDSLTDATKRADDSEAAMTLLEETFTGLRSR